MKWVGGFCVKSGSTFKPGRVLWYQDRMEKILSDLYIKVDLQQLNTVKTLV